VKAGKFNGIAYSIISRLVLLIFVPKNRTRINFCNFTIQLFIGGSGGRSCCGSCISSSSSSKQQVRVSRGTVVVVSTKTYVQDSVSSS